jgi:hypothetical protein
LIKACWSILDIVEGPSGVESLIANLFISAGEPPCRLARTQSGSPLLHRGTAFSIAAATAFIALMLIATAYSP